LEARHRLALREGQKENKKNHKKINEGKKNMAKTKKLLLSVVILSLLLVCIIFAALTPNVHAAEVNIQQRGLEVTNSVIGLDLSKYSVTTKEDLADQHASYLGLVPQENVKYNLVSDSGELNVLYTFAEGNLQMIQVLENFGKPITNKLPTVAPKMAYDFLSDYQTYTDNPLYGELKSTLKGVDAGKNLTKTEGNTVLEVTYIDGYTNFKWYYTDNGAIAPYSKFIALSFKNHFLSAFVDNWQFYDVGSSNIKLSKEEVSNIALEAARTHSWSGKLDDDTLDAAKFNSSNIKWASLTFDNSLGINNTRSEDPLVLYPVWRVGVALDKWYGQLYGVVVAVWADTGEVRSVEEAWSTLPQPSANANKEISLFSEASFLIAFPSTVLLFAGTSIWISRKKKLHFQSLFKARSSKIVGLMLFVLIAILLLAPITGVSATSRGAAVWGSESTGQNDPPGTPRKSSNEINLQQSTAAFIAEAFGDNGYTGGSDGEINHQGSVNLGSSKQQILSDIFYLTGYDDYVAVVDFDHGNWANTTTFPTEGHYMLEDNRGNWYDDDGPGEHTNPPQLHQDTSGVYDYEIWGYGGSTQKIAFAFINTCASANLTLGNGMIYGQWPIPDRAVGMPFAFTGNPVSANYLSSDGYQNPDTGSHVYIGFHFGSPSLEQTIPDPYYGSVHHYEWVLDFFEAALYEDISVNQALDSASLQNFGNEFVNSPYRKDGFIAHWEGLQPSPDSAPGQTMAVFGNGNIRLKNFDPSVHSVGRPTTYAPASGIPNTNYTFTTSAADSSYGHTIRYIFDWDDGTYTTTGYYANGEKVNASHSWSSAGDKVVTVTAQCDTGTYGSGVSYNTINIVSHYWLTVSAHDAYVTNCPIDTNIWIDGDWVDTTSVSVYLPYGEHTVTVDNGPIYDEAWAQDAYFVGFSGDCYDMGYTPPTAYVYIDGDSAVDAIYFPYF
jgi:hypothetical protein